MTTSRVRTGLAVLTSLAVVLVPVAGAAGAVDLARELTVDGSADREWGAALLRVACLASAGTLVWAAFAAAAGVRDGWRRARGRDARTPESVTGPWVGEQTPDGAGRTYPGRTGGLVTATVAALVVAALVAPSAAASDGARVAVTTVSTAYGAQAAPATGAGMAGVGMAGVGIAGVGIAGVDVAGVDVVDEAAGDGSSTTAGGSPAPSGSWEALAEAAPAERSGFVAPRAIDPTTASLVTGTVTRERTSPREVVVTGGDSLWSIAAAALGPGADDADVAVAWPRWWQANRDVIGDDPHLLRPGQRLVEPAP